MRIRKIDALEVIDSRGNPTVEAVVTLADGVEGRAIVPSGASTGKYEVLELRDNDQTRYSGMGVLTAINNVRERIAPELISAGELDQAKLDGLLLSLDGTADKSALGANAILAVSMAFAWAASTLENKPLYAYIADLYGNVSPQLPRPMFNILNGGKHGNWATDIQEYMVVPLLQKDFSHALQVGVEVFHSLGDVLKGKGLSINVGNEGGYAPQLQGNEQALDIIMQAIELAGYTPGDDVAIALDIAASEFLVTGESDEDQYSLKRDGLVLSSDEWIEKLDSLVRKYPIISLEDPLGQDAWEEWSRLVKRFGSELEQVVGDDLLVTNTSRIEKAIEHKSCNALLVKPNQIGTITETLAAMHLAQDAGWANVVSHRSGETEDVTISHLVVGTACGQLKSGAPSRGERTAKFNELLRIEHSWSE